MVSGDTDGGELGLVDRHEGHVGWCGSDVMSGLSS
jgi:hypothetical protein